MSTDLPLKAQVLAYIREHRLLEGAKTVLCAFSGGADSACLLHILRSLQEELGFRLCAAHYNHQLRGEESLRDAAFAEAFCKTLQLPFYVGSGDVAAHAAETGQGLEAAGRELRYAFLEACAGKLPACVIATAHQADDQVETVLLHMLRGSGLGGLTGIPPRRGNIIRPLLFASRREILAYLEENCLEHVEDSSNACQDFTRNLLRQKVLPVLEELNPAYARQVRRMTELLSEDEIYLRSQAHILIEQDGSGVRLSASGLRLAAVPIASRAIRACAQHFGVQPEKKHVDALLAMVQSGDSGSMDFPGGLRCMLKGGCVCFARPEETEGEPSFPETLLHWNQWTEIPETDYRVFWGEAVEDAKINALFTTFFFKRDRICGNMLVRPRKSGDSVCLQGRNVTKSLKKLMIELKIPAEQRSRIPVFVDDAGVLAVLGAGADSRAACVPEEADAVLCITERNKGNEIQP